MIGGGYSAHMLGVVVVDVTFVFQEINHRFVGVVKIPAMCPAGSTMNLDCYLSETLDGFPPGNGKRDLFDPIHVNSAFVKVPTASSLPGAKELVCAGWDR